MSDSPVQVFGIRHHGPGSSRSLLRALEAYEPDAVLIEGPPDADEALQLMGHESLVPPVALLVYVPDEPRRAAFYPFATYSPEWQAARYALRHELEVRFIDLPQRHQLLPESDDAQGSDEPMAAEQPPPDAAADGSLEDDVRHVRRDPLGYLAEAAGFADGERWWDHMVESRRDDTDLFDAIREAMTALRQELGDDAYGRDAAEVRRELQREAHMRRCIREAIKAGRQRVAVVCGAWHVPALVEMPTAKHDNDLLKALPKVKTEVAWSPWTYQRLASMSGYGAGVQSPEWYHLLWDARQNAATTEPATLWLTRVARLMRDQDLDASSAHVIESVRLARTLATLRGRSAPGLQELDEAALTVLCTGQPAPLRLIHASLVVGHRIGSVPDDAPMPPLQRDLQKLQKSLRLKPTSEVKALDLDLRKPIDLDRSHLLHRLNLLGITWGTRQEGQRRSTGTFHENWQLQWEPGLAVAVVEASRYGPTVQEAASAKVAEAAADSDQLAELTAMLDDAMLANLPAAVSTLVDTISRRAATGSDVNQLLGAIPALVSVCRYGNVRQTDAQVVRHVLDEMLTRACVGLTNACASLNDDAAAAMFDRLVSVHDAVVTLDHADHTEAWLTALQQLVHLQSVHGLVVGRAARLLYDRGAITPDDTTQQMSLRLSPAAGAPEAAAWIEGFLRNSGLILIHDPSLFSVLRQWVAQLNDERFEEVLPLVRRTFATFAGPERRQMGELLRQGPGTTTRDDASSGDFDMARVAPVLDTLELLLKPTPPEPT